MLARALTLFGCFAAATVVIAHASQSEPTPIRASLALFPTTLGEWRSVQQPPFDEKTLAVLGVDDYLTRAYFRSPRSGVGLYIGYYRSQRQGDTIHSPLNCLPGSGWEPLSKSTIPIAVASSTSEAPEDRRIFVNRYVVQKGLDRELVLYWYQSHGRVVASEYVSKFYLIADAVRLNRTDAALVRVISRIPSNLEDGEAHAVREAVQFVKDLFPRLGGYLPS
jgi:EpsI family protein